MLIKIKTLSDLKTLFSVFTFLFITACNVPSDVSNPIVAASTSGLTYAGFTGITAATTVSATRVKIQWNLSTDSTVVAYNIYDTTNYFSPVLLRTVLVTSDPVASSSYTLTGLSTASAYSFRVRAANASNVEDTNTNDIQAIPYGGIISAAVTSGSSATLTVSAITNADSASVYCLSGSATTYTLLQTYRVTSNMTTTFLNGIYTNSLNLTEGLSAGVTYTCKVNITEGSVTDNNSNTVSFTPVGAADHITLTSIPASGVARSTLTPIVVTIYDNAGNVVVAGPDSNATIHLYTTGTDTFYNSSGTTIGTTVSMAAVNGVATFTGYSMRYPAGYKTLNATKLDTTAVSVDGVSGTPQMVTSNLTQFMLAAGPADQTKSTISVTPTGTAGISVDNNTNGGQGYTVQIQLLDLDTNPVIGSSTAFSTSLNSQPETANFTINGPGTTDSNGLANDTSSYAIGSFISSVSGTHVLSITSPSFTVPPTVNAIFNPGAPAKLGLSNFPSSAPAGANGISTFNVQLLDQFGNNVTSSTYNSDTINLTIASCSPPASLPSNCNSPQFVQGGNDYTTVSAPISGGSASFSGLGIALSGNYQLNASLTLSSSSTIQTKFSSNPLTVGVGTPVQLVIAQASPSPSPATIVSGNCGSSTAFTLQFEDASGQVAAPGASVTVHLASTGSAQFYLDSACSTTAITSILPSKFTATTKTVTVYVKDVKSENVTLSAYTTNITISSPYLGNSSSPATLAVTVTPASLSLTGLSGTTPITSALSGVCIPFKLQLEGSDSSAAIGSVISSSVLFTLNVTNSANTTANAKIYSDSACSTQITNLSNLSIASTSGASSSGTAVAGNNLTFYIKDMSVETLSLGISATNTGTGINSSLGNTFYITPSQFKIMEAANPSPSPNSVSVVAGAYNIFTVQLLDASGTPAPINQSGVTVPVKINITGSSSATAGFYTGNSSSGYTALASSTTTLSSANVTTTATTPTLSLYDTKVETLTITASDPSNVIATSASLSVKVYPKQFKVVPMAFNASNYTLTGVPYSSSKYANASTPSSSNTGVCAGFNVLPYDATGTGNAGAATTALTPTTISLTASSTVSSAIASAYTLYSDPGCSIPLITSTANPQGTISICSGTCNTSSTDSTSFYFLSNYPGALTFTASDTNNNVPTSTPLAWTVNAARGWLGSGSHVTVPNSSGTSSPIFWNTTYTAPKTAVTDVAQNINALRVSANGNYLYVADSSTNKVLQYNYATNQYVGWLGTVQVQGDYPVIGSGVSSSMASNCENLTSGTYLTSNSSTFYPTYVNTPGWCLGGTSAFNPYLATTGGLANPVAVVDDGTYVYVANQYTATITRHKVSDGSFQGWIGNLISTSSYTGTGNSNTGLLNNVNINYSIPSLSPASDINGNSLYTLSSATAGYYTPGWSIGGGIIEPTIGYGGGNQSYLLAGSAVSMSNGGNGLGSSYLTNSGGIASAYYAGGTNANNGNRIFGSITAMAYGTDNVTPATSPSPVPYLYVGTNSGQVHRVNAYSGAYMGWIGTVSSGTSPSNITNPSDQTSCANTVSLSSAAVVGTNTSGWCLNGSGYSYVTSTYTGTVTGIAVDNTNNLLYVARSYGYQYFATNYGGWNYYSSIAVYNLITGAFLYNLNFEGKTGSSYTIMALGQISIDSTTTVGSPVLYIANGDRLMRFSVNNTGANSSTPGTLKLLGWTGKTGTTIQVSDGLTPPSTMGGTPGDLSGTCSGVSANQTTNQWCYGEPTSSANVAQPSLEPAAFINLWAIADDGNGNILTGQSTLPMIKKFSKTTGSLEGILVNGTSGTTLTKNVSNAPGAWTDSQAPIDKAGLGDQDMNAPSGSWIDANNNLYIAEAGNGRIKKVNLFTGQTLGWIGGTAGFISALPGTLPATSTTAACGSYSTGYGFTYPATSSNNYQWCVGAYPNVTSLIPMSFSYAETGPSLYSNSASIGSYFTSYVGGGYTGNLAMNEAFMSLPSVLPAATPSDITGTYLVKPVGISGDSTYLYVVDAVMYRMLRFKLSDGSFQGWVGGISSTLGMSAASSSCPSNLVVYAPSTFTSQGYMTTACWVFGGLPSTVAGMNYSGSNFYSALGGFMSTGTPSGITVATTNGTEYVYVADTNRINRYNASTGAFAGWIGQGILSGSSPATSYTINGTLTTTSSANGWSTLTPATPNEYSPTNGWILGGWATNYYNGCGANGSCTYDTRGLISGSSRMGITNDGINLYVSNANLHRIDAFDLATGVYQKSAAVNISYIAGSSNGGFLGWIVNPLASTSTGSITTGCNTATPGVTGTCNTPSSSTGTAQQSTLNNQWAFFGGSTNVSIIPEGLTYSNGYLYASVAYNNYMLNTSLPNATNAYTNAILKIDASGTTALAPTSTAGQVIGWKGGIGSKPSGTAGTACINSSGVGDSGFTSNWCYNGFPLNGNTLGISNPTTPSSVGSSYYSELGLYPTMGFQQPYMLSTDGNYVYVGDEGQHRLIRIPVTADASPEQ